jgi:hypothetical protein
MGTNIFKSIVWIILIGAICSGIVYFLNKDYIDIANKEVITIKPETFTESVRNSVEFDDIVEITGTPNLLQQVSQESSRNTEDSVRNTYYYVGLKEYGYSFVVRVKKGKVVTQQQTFKGIVTGLSRTEFGTRIKNSLNKPINFDDSVNRDISRELDDEIKKKISDQSVAEFTDSTFLILDEEVVELNHIYSNILMYSAMSTIFVVTVFRKRIFPGLNNRGEYDEYYDE